jgi:hypothetical protein
LCCCRFVKGRSAAQIVDEHGLDDGMSKPGSKTGQGDRLMRTRVVTEFSSVNIGILHADLNSAAQTLAACTQMPIRQRATACASRWFDLARSKTWTKDCPRHVRDQQETQQELAVGAARWACRTWVVAVMISKIMGSWGLNMGADQGLLSTH